MKTKYNCIEDKGLASKEKHLVGLLATQAGLGIFQSQGSV